MGRAPCCDKANVKKGPWSPEEDAKLKAYIEKHGTGGNWIAFPTKAGLRRCGKSCRLRWLNYLRPNIKHGEFTDDEDRIICNLFANIGSRWSIIAAQLPGRTDNDIKNYWNTKLKKKLMGLISSSQKRPHQSTPNYPSISLLDHHTQSSSSSPPSYKCSNNTTYYTIPINSSFNGYDHHQQPMSIPSINLQTQDSFVGPIQHYHSDHLLMFGGDHHQASCSSSDGSRDVEYEYGVCNNNNNNNNNGDHQQMGFNLQSYTYNGVDENQKIMISNGYEEKPNGLCSAENPLDYGLEEIKQLISTNIVSNNFNFFVDENKTVEKAMYY